MSEPSVTVYTCPDGTPFPVTWPDAEAPGRGWFWDQLHNPSPTTPLSDEFGDDLAAGFRRAADYLGSPAHGLRLDAHGYRFFSVVPFPGDPGARAAVRLRDEEERLPRLLELWHSEYLPETEALTRSIRLFEHDRPGLKQMIGRLPEVHAARRRHGELHMLALGLTAGAANVLLDWCGRRFGDAGEGIGLEMVQGLPNRSLDSARALWDLSRTALALPAVAGLLRTSPASEFLAKLTAAAGGAEFREHLDNYLEEYGYRNESFFELLHPTWREDPRFPVLLLRRYVDQPEGQSPAALHDRAANRRLARISEVEGMLGPGDPTLAEFREMVRIAQQRTLLIEDHNFSIDQRGFTACRVPILAIGRELARQGAIAVRDDIFYLVEEEIREASMNPSVSFSGFVAERRAERERWLRVLPPTFVGDGAVSLTASPLARFWGTETMAKEPDPPGVVRGIAGSPGIVRGVARLILSLDDVDRLEPGEILVTYATAPPWTPLFAIAGGIVTDAGGNLSHCAVVAREYGIPAVVGTRTATATICDGMVITVDGSGGVIRIEE